MKNETFLSSRVPNWNPSFPSQTSREDIQSFGRFISKVPRSYFDL